MNTENFKVCTIETTKHKKPRLTDIQEILSTHSETSAMNRFNDLVLKGKKVFVALLDGEYFQRFKAKNFDDVDVVLP